MDHKVQRNIFNINAGNCSGCSVAFFFSIDYAVSTFPDSHSHIFAFLMKLCGVRGDGNAAAKSLFWQPRKGLSYVLTCESERERNAAIMVARKHALDCSVSSFFPYILLQEVYDVSRYEITFTRSVLKFCILTI